MAEMGIPRLHKSGPMLGQKRPQAIDFIGPKAMGLRETDRLQPELRDVVTVFNIYVRRFGAPEAIKEEPEAGYSQHSRHWFLKPRFWPPCINFLASYVLVNSTGREPCDMAVRYFRCRLPEASVVSTAKDIRGRETEGSARRRHETIELLGVTLGKSGATSNHRVIGFALIEVSWLRDRPLTSL
jgi:hypothetical protein